MGKTSATGRQQVILELLRTQGEVTVNDLVDQFDVSAATIRRDLDVLAQHRRVDRVHGGAVLPQPITSYEPLYAEKTTLNQEEKARIGAAASELVADGQTIILDSGSTAYQLAINLVDKRGLTVVTTDLYVAVHLSSMPDIRVLMVGGGVRTNQFNSVGRFAEYCLSNINADSLFLAVDGVDLEKGVTVTDIDEATVKKVMINSSRQVNLIADHSKFGRVALANIVGISTIDHIITDTALNPSFVEALHALDVRLTLA